MRDRARWRLAWPRVAGVRLQMHPVFALLLAVGVAGGLGREVAVLTLVLAGHEIGHLLAARAFGLRVAALELLPFGGVLRVENLDLADPGVEAAVALIGPLHNLVMLAAGFALREAGWLQPQSGSFFLLVNAAIGAGNLLPAMPLDGGRAARAMLARRCGSAAAAAAMHRAGYALATLLAGLGAGLILLRGVLVPGLFVFAGFVLMRAGPERQEAAVRPWRQALHRTRALRAAGVLPVQALATAADMPLRALVGRFAPGAYHLVWVVAPDGRARGPWDEAQVREALARCGAGATAADLGEPRRG